MSSEICQRCGEEGPDRRTLWHACLYQMKELGIPFEEIDLFSLNKDQLNEKKEMLPWSSTTTYSDGRQENNSGEYEKTKFLAKSDAEANRRHFYTLHVCKECRADWMQMIKTWFDRRCR